ncbi:MAG TPA: amidohydrolase family protein [Acidimicrobiales bacterium]|nr:amidohydrolase family protein [Acidimicrobiales bacterium]
MSEEVDFVIEASHVVTMNPTRDVLVDGAVAVRGRDIVAVGKRAEIADRYQARQTIGGPRFVLTPGMVNTHIHVTGEPITRGFVPDDTPFEENVFAWLCPLYAAQDEDDERVSAQLASAELLKSGCTAFLEAGTVQYVDAVVDALVEVGIRARVGKWIWDIPPEPEVYRQTTQEAIANVESTLRRHRHVAGGRIQAWSMIVGHTTCSDELWRAAADAARRHGTGLNFHMSPAAMDPEGFLAQFGQRPVEHLSSIGVLGANAVLVHCVHVDDSEISLLAQHGCSVAHCPTTALKVSYGVTQIGRMPEMKAAGINLTIGTDGNNASNYSDMMRATYLVAGLFKDARRDPTMFPAEVAYEMATLGGAKALLAEDEIGSIEPGKRADLVLHDRNRPEWTPLLNVANQLVWAADGRGVHTVMVDGKVLVEAYRLTTIDEDRLYDRVQERAEALVARTGLPDRSKWPTV